MTHLVSMSSNQYGLNKYSNENASINNKWKGVTFKKGDMNTTLIHTNNGKTIMLQHDVTSPRPYSRLFTVSGTEGFIQKYPVQSMSFSPNSHRSLNSKDINDTIIKYQPHLLLKILNKKLKK